jgi:DNA-binding transcriptional ArsR family regulator
VSADTYFVEADHVRQRPFRVSVTPLPSLLTVLVDALGTGSKGTPPVWRKSVRLHLRAQDYETLAPLVIPGPRLVPDPLFGCVDPPGESLRDGIERMIATPLDVLMDEVAICGMGSSHDAWALVERDPGRWLRLYVASLLRAWKGFGPIWRGARSALSREVERVGVATALDAQLELLDGLLPHGGVEDGRWTIHYRFATGPRRFPRTGLVLVPLVAGPLGSLLDVSPETIARIGYPLRPTPALGAEDAPVAALEGLLGIPRAQILRAVQRPTSIGDLAETLHAVPSAATHHVTALEAAGLVTRDRRGRNVMVQRTARGEALLDLYGDVAGQDGRRVGSGRR